MQQQTKFLDHDGITCRPTPGRSRELTASGRSWRRLALTCVGKFVHISAHVDPVTSPSHAAIELALIGVTAHCVADIHCR